MQSKKEKISRQKQAEENLKRKNIVYERLKHLSWWGWSTGLNASTSIEQF